MATHRDERIKRVLLVARRLILFLLCYNVPELRVGDFARALRVRLGNHSENFFLRCLLAHHFEDDAQLVCIDLTAAVLVEGAEGLIALGVFLFREPVIVLISCLLFCHDCFPN